MEDEEQSNVLGRVFEEAVNLLEASEVTIFNGEAVYITSGDGEMLRLEMTEKQSRIFVEDYENMILVVDPERIMSNSKFDGDADAKIVIFIGGEDFAIRIGKRDSGVTVFSARRIFEENLRA